VDGALHRMQQHVFVESYSSLKGRTSADMEFMDEGDADLAYVERAGVDRVYAEPAELHGSDGAGTKVNQADVDGSDGAGTEVNQADVDGSDGDRADLNQVYAERADVNSADGDPAGTDVIGVDGPGSEVNRADLNQVYAERSGLNSADGDPVDVENIDGAGVNRAHTDRSLVFGSARVREETRSSKGLPRHDIFGFPRGAHTGNFWHHIFEMIDFSEPAGHEQVVREACQEFGFDFDDWGSVLMEMVGNVVNASLGDFRLSEVTRSRALREMEFHLPYRESALLEYIRWIQSPDDAESMAVHPQGGAVAQHYLKGFIDLLVEHKGKYYILDYKSDHLGDAIESYGAESLHSHMQNNGYIMQYYFYSLALYLYLRERLDDFDFDKAFGGVCYLFLRGISTDGSSGVYTDRPDSDRIAHFAKMIQEIEKRGES
jgi:uncharacterized protein YjbI with pentapeptide repeats